MKLFRTRALLAGSLLLATFAAGAAQAHVTVNPREATAGGFAKLAFRVPNERDGASTVGVKVTFPTASPLAFVSVRPKAGWTVQVTRSKLATPLDVEGTQITEAVSAITWTGGRINPGEFDEFEVSVGPLPEAAGDLTFLADQTYSNGEVVQWNEPRVEGGEEPEHPAPVLKLTAAAASAPTASTSAVAVADDEDEESNVLGIVGVTLGGLALVVAGAALAGSRKPAAA